MASDPPRTPPRGAAIARPADACGWVRGAGGAPGWRPTWTEADEAAGDLLRSAGWSRALRLLGPTYGGDMRFVDEVALRSWLAAAIRSGDLVPEGGEDGGEPVGRWHAVRVLGAERVLLTVERKTPGLRRIPLDKPGMAARAVAQLWSGPNARAHLLELVSATGPVPPKLDEAALKALAVSRLEEGSISLFFREDMGDAQDAAQPAPVVSAAKPTESSKSSVVDHWIEIVLLDDAGSPMAGEKYEITLPDGSLRRGALGADGKAKITGIAQGGSCQVGFPDIDAREWRPA